MKFGLRKYVKEFVTHVLPPPTSVLKGCDLLNRCKKLHPTVLKRRGRNVTNAKSTSVAVALNFLKLKQSARNIKNGFTLSCKTFLSGKLFASLRCRKLLPSLNRACSAFQASTSPYGFTLAEVLITLVVLGIIAAVTVPTLRNSLGDNSYRVPLKKTYATLSEAFDITMRYSSFSRTARTINADTFFQFASTFIDNIAISKLCCASGTDKTAPECYSGRSGSSDGVCFTRNVLAPDKSGYMTNPMTNSNIKNALVFLLKDGTSVSIYPSSSFVAKDNYYGIDANLRKGYGSTLGTCVYKSGTTTKTLENVTQTKCDSYEDSTYTVTGSNETFLVAIVDVNGLRGPNINGKDVHAFVYTATDGLIPAGADKEATGGTVLQRWDKTAAFLEKDKNQ